VDLGLTIIYLGIGNRLVISHARLSIFSQSVSQSTTKVSCLFFLLEVCIVLAVNGTVRPFLLGNYSKYYIYT